MSRQAEGLSPKIGVAIAAFNCRDHLRRCLNSSGIRGLLTVVVDSGSTDDTLQMLRTEFPDVIGLSAATDVWWTGGTNRAANECLQRSCSHVLLMNPDVEIDRESVDTLVAFAQQNRIVASLVVMRGDETRVMWAGSRWRRVLPGWPVWTSRYNVARGSSRLTLGSVPLVTDEVHGRAVLISASTFRALGGFDEDRFPHYGADSDFSLRARAAGIEMWVHPGSLAVLDSHHSGMAIRPSGWSSRLFGLWQYLTSRKHGDAVRVWWRLLSRHLPVWEAVPSFVFVLSLNVLRRLLPRRSGGQ